METVEDFNISLASMDISLRQKINKKIVTLTNVLDHLDLTCIYGIFLSKFAEYTMFSVAHGTLCIHLDHVRPPNKSINLRRLKSHQTFFLTTTT